MSTDGCEADDVAEVGWQIHALDFLACTQHCIVFFGLVVFGNDGGGSFKPNLSHQATASTCPGYCSRKIV